MKLIKKLLAGIFWVCSLSPTIASDLTIEILNLKNNLGNIHIALFNSSVGFPYNDAIFSEKETPIKNNKATTIFKNLPTGVYAIAAYHDENDNDEFDQSFLGIPSEDFGFSNGARVFFGPPSFNQAKFFIQKINETKTINLN
jgi:uncharacterized protein (DUF2141 family)